LWLKEHQELDDLIEAEVDPGNIISGQEFLAIHVLNNLWQFLSDDFNGLCLGAVTHVAGHRGSHF
jgi:hypothetical protein